MKHAAVFYGLMAIACAIATDPGRPADGNRLRARVVASAFWPIMVWDLLDEGPTE